MPENTGMTAVLVNPAIPVDLTPEQQADLDALKALREKLLAAGIKTDFTTGRAPKTEPPVYSQHIKRSIDDVMPMVREAMQQSDGSVIAFFPQLTDESRVVTKINETQTSGRKAYRFAVYYTVKAEKTGKLRNEGAKFMVVNDEQAATLGVKPGDAVALSFVSYPGEQKEAEDRVRELEQLEIRDRQATQEASDLKS